jgi:predicted RND superfamily exporter protein
MRAAEKIAGHYGRLLAEHPYTVIAVVIVLTALAAYGNSILKHEAEQYADVLPEDIELIRSLNYIQDEFGGTESGKVVVEIDPSVEGSVEVRDVRDPRVLKYVDILAQKVGMLEDVTSVSSAADIVKEGGRIPQSHRVIDGRLKENPQSSSYVSSDYSMTVVQMQLADGFDEEELFLDVEDIVLTTPKPAGVKANPSGDYAIGTSMQRQIGPDMSRTSNIALIGVLAVIIMLFRSLRYGLTSLLAIVFGSMWSFGLMGLLGWSVTSTTSGGASMIMGIGIDFGIQVTQRFRLELRRGTVVKAMVRTLQTVTIPMSTTTLAALVGFRAMSLGELRILSDLADMMTLGVLCSMIAAVTIVPSALVLGEKYFSKKS